MLSLRTILEVFVIFVFLEQNVKAAVSCPSGDTAGVIKDGEECSALITADNAECYNTTIESACCSSCNSVNTGISGCSYGDTTACFLFLCTSYVDISLCCETCDTGTTGAPTTTTSTTTSTTTTSTTTSSTTASSAPTTSTTAASAPTTSSGSSGSTGGYEGGSSNRDNGGVIAGAVIGSIVSAGLLAMGAFLLARWYNKKNKTDDESKQNLPEKVDSDHKPADINNDVPIKAYNNNPVFNAQTVPPTATGIPNNHNLNNNTNKDETTLKTEQTNNKRNEENKNSNKDDKTSNETDNDTEIRRQHLSPLQGAKPGITPSIEPLPPIADSK